MPELKESVAQLAPEKDGIRGEQKNVESVRKIMRDVGETSPHVPHEVRTWMEKIEGANSPTASVNDDSGQPVLVPTNKSPIIQLPISQTRFVQGFKKTVGDAGKWLSAFVLKLIKKKKGNVKFKEE